MKCNDVERHETESKMEHCTDKSANQQKAINRDTSGKQECMSAIGEVVRACTSVLS